MKENEIDIMILRINNYDTKSKIMFEYCTPDEPSQYSKGMLILQQWLSGTKYKTFFDEFNLDDIARPLKAHFEYQKTFRGQARMVLTDIYDDNGELLYEF